MRVENITQDRRTLQLAVSLQNNGSEEVEFLYSFLEVRDQDNNLLSSFTDSLPPSLPVDRQAYKGTIELFGPLPDSVRSVSIRLASYPDEKVKLQIDAIPIP
ncbi:hypothetical protein [Synechocystis sp. CACIAM 05]|uniref:hypothetical protein n=1 Tax=Synechocystis sp. CACIAM 05 TaxID=1933929 RepID=UPI00138E832F|nr:hypothetical protein [Synechocystis sp. CACIAM 05]QHV00103.1 hypothetical protein BWK47_08155 [Synechocystis sp. CACIAM 05]